MPCPAALPRSTPSCPAAARRAPRPGELLLPHAGVGEIRLLAPALVAAQRAGRLVMVFDPPAALSASALARLGLDLDELLVVDTRGRAVPGSDSLWALEQALKSGHVGAIVYVRISARKSSEMIARLLGTRSAPAAPCTARNAMSAFMLGAAPQANEATPKERTPMMNTRRRP